MSGRRASTAAGRPGGTAGERTAFQRIGRDTECGGWLSTQNRQGVLIVGARPLKLLLLRERRLQLRLRLIEDDGARETGPDLHPEQAHLLLVRPDGLVYDFELGIEHAHGVVDGSATSA